MTYVVAEPCVNCRYTDCALVCPVEAFHLDDDMLVIHPETCIDCDAGLGMNYEHVIVEVKRFDGANQSAISVTTINAWFGDDISHLNQPPGVIWLLHQQPISQKLRNYIKHEMRRNRSYDVLANDTAMRRSNPALSGVAFSELVRL